MEKRLNICKRVADEIVTNLIIERNVCMQCTKEMEKHTQTLL